MQETINLCLGDDPEERPDFTKLESEAFFYLIESLCDDSREESDAKAVQLI
jgi:hypothetical protein